MPQTSVTEPAAALVGAIAYPARVSVRGSYVNENAGALAFGLGVVKGTGDDKADLSASTGDVTDKFLGVAFRDPMKEFDAGGYASGDQMTVVEKGYVYVTVEAAVDKGKAAFMVHSGANSGQFRADANAGAATQVEGARFASSTTGAGIAILELF